MDIIVQKFGGTSLDHPDKRMRVANRVKQTINKGCFPVVVVSAMGRKGCPYATDTLINLARDSYLYINPREKDLIMSCGEVISSVVMVQALKSFDIEATALTGAQAGIITDNNYGESSIKSVNKERIIKLINEDKVPVIAGFQGISEDGEITTLGRGGSDTTASVIGAALGAKFVEIYTDVDGVMTADPVIVDEAQILDEVSYNEVCELAYQGARVIHPRAAEIAMAENIPIKIKSTSGNSHGTTIHNYGMKSIKGDRPVTGITSRNDIVFVKIEPHKPAEYATGLKVFKLMAEEEISVDFINIRSDAISFVINEDKWIKARGILKKNNFNYQISDQFSKVSVVGGGMTGQPGIMAKIVDALNNADISIYQTTDSHTTISCLLKKKAVEKAINILHRAFSLNTKNEE